MRRAAAEIAAHAHEASGTVMLGIRSDVVPRFTSCSSQKSSRAMAKAVHEHQRHVEAERGLQEPRPRLADHPRERERREGEERPSSPW